MKIVLVLGLALLAGCADGPSLAAPATSCEVPDRIANLQTGSTDWSLETFQVTTQKNSGVLKLGLPVNAMTGIAEWLANGTGSNYEVLQDGQETWLHLHGVATFASCSVQPARQGNGCCAEAYLDTRWSAGEYRILSITATEPTDFTMDYEASSKYCGGELHVDIAVQAGVTDLESIPFWCT